MGLPVFIPGEIALLLAGSRLLHSAPALGAAILAFGTLDFVATSTLHLLARTGGNVLLRGLLRRLIKDERPEEVVARWRRRLGGHDSVVIFCVRMVPVVRMTISLASGLLRMRLRSFAIGAAPAAYLWAAIPLTAGYLLRSHVGTIEQHYTQIIGAILLVTVVCLVLVLRYRGLWGREAWAARERRVP